MPTSDNLTQAQATQLLNRMLTISNSLRTLLIDPAFQDPAVVPVGTMNLLTADAQAVNSATASFADATAKVVFADSDAAFEKLDYATKSAADSLESLRSDVAHVSRIVKLVGAVIAFGTAAASLNAGAILAQADALLGASV